MHKLSEKRWPDISVSLNPFRPTLSLARGGNQKPVYCTGVMIYNKTRQLLFLFLLTDKHFWVWELHQIRMILLL